MWPEWCRDTDLMSQQDSGCLVVVWCHDQGFGSRQGRFCGKSKGWLRHRFEVETWPVEIGCHDLGQAAFACRDQLTPSKPVTCAGCARYMHATGRLCAQQRPLPGHCARSVRTTWVLGGRTVHLTQF